MRERARVRGKCLIMPHSFPLIRPIGHLLLQGEGISGESELIRKDDDFWWVIVVKLCLSLRFGQI